MEYNVSKINLKELFLEKLSLILAILLYLLIYFLRAQQGGWEPELDLFPQMRQNMDNKISELLPSPQADLLSGILLGNKKDLPYEFRLALRDTSTLHIVVVSGQNLSMIAGLFLMLSGLIKRKVAIILSFSAIIFYTLLTGADIPVLRAAVMVSLAFLAQLLGRQQDGFWALVLTGGLMLLVNPAWITNLSFQLSFMATMGLVVVAPILLKYFKSLPLIGQDLAVTLGAQTMVMPIIIQNFHQLSLVSVLANLAVGWSVPFIMILGTVMLALGLVSDILGQVISLLIYGFLTYFIYIVEFFAALPFAWEYMGEQIWIVWVGYYLLLGGVLVALRKTVDGRK